jgi:hypothetical protein
MTGSLIGYARLGVSFGSAFESLNEGQCIGDFDPAPELWPCQHTGQLIDELRGHQCQGLKISCHAGIMRNMKHFQAI